MGVDEMNQPTLRDEKAMWQAVLGRDASRDGDFVFAVRSTRIYCRPSCPARRPRREQVSFYATPNHAREAGYRPCKRCRPDEPGTPVNEFVSQVRAYIDAHVDEKVTLEDLGRLTQRSPYHLQRVFKHVTGQTPKQYALSRRLVALKGSLRSGRDVTSALYEVGYGSSSDLYANAHADLGMTPATYRAGGLGAQIQYTLQDSPLGRLLVAYTEHGVCMVSLGDDDESLIAALRKEYPQADLHAAMDAGQPWAAAIEAYLRGASSIDVPVDVPGTAFQRQVWQALREIPFGSTRTYQQIAEKLGNPKAVRAVGHACATNPVALVVPCHRAVRTDGGLGGYRWGIQRKERLLAQENRDASR
jgi:AraC family transcriptional regulator of adaptative response/methylated-DNA-[protein]-cysteine methyltransferase